MTTQSELRLPCGYCDLTLPDHQSLIQHIEANHDRLGKRNNNHGAAATSSQVPSGMAVPDSPSRPLSEVSPPEDTPPPPLPAAVPLTTYSCQPCQLQFAQERLLQEHIEQKHKLPRQQAEQDPELCQRQSQSRLQPSPSEPDTRQSDECGDCDQIFADGTSLARHKAALHTITMKSSSTTKHKWECHVCGKTFPFRTRLVHHLPVHESAVTRERPHSCNECGKSFFRRGDLWAHRKIHTGTRYTCGECGKTLSSSGALHNHRALHDTAKHFRCDVCGRTFALRQKYTTHLMSHDRRKPFECAECGVGFVHKQSWVAHQRGEHDVGEELKCDFCSKPFRDQAYLNQHLKWHRRVQQARASLKQE